MKYYAVALVLALFAKSELSAQQAVSQKSAAEESDLQPSPAHSSTLGRD